MAKGVSDRYLQAMWRKAVLKRFDNSCVICGRERYPEELECHHIVKRRFRVLRHDPDNGVAVCKIKCHAFADSLMGQAVIAAKLGESRMHYLAERQQMNVKDYRFQLGFSKEELEQAELTRLKKELG